VTELPYNLKPNLSGGGVIEAAEEGTWRLGIPAGPAGSYRLAQLDDYSRLRRADFPHKPPLRMRLQVRASSATIPGTWGFGLWNDPFGMGALSGKGPRLPTLPNAAWFFFASPENYLSLRDDLPANGALSAVFRSPMLAGGILLLAAPALALMLIPPAARLARRLGRRIVKEDAAALRIGPGDWHEYSLDWRASKAHFQVDGETVLHTEAAPEGRLGLVIWIDNQYAALAPDGKARYGMLASEEARWIEVRGLAVEAG